jgi:hypothetical protein
MFLLHISDRKLSIFFLFYPHEINYILHLILENILYLIIFLNISIGKNEHDLPTQFKEIIFTQTNRFMI